MIYRVSNEVACQNVDALFVLHDFNRLMPITGWDFWGNASMFEICESQARQNPAMSVDELASILHEHINTWREAWLMAKQYHHFCNAREQDNAHNRRLKWWGGAENAINFSMDFENATVYFSSMGAVPLPIYARLSFLYPEDRIEVRYASENLGIHAGTMSFQFGVLLEHTHYPDGTKRAYKEGFHHWGQDKTYVEQADTFIWQDKMDTMVS